MADIVRDILDKSARQRKVIFQKKKPLLNYELNFAQDILREGLEDLTRVSIGDNFAGDSFKVDPGLLTNEIFIRKGVFYHKGVPISLTADKRMPVGTPPGTGTRLDIVYATWRIVQSDSPSDPLIGFSTTQEQRVELDIVCETGTSVPTNVPSEIITFTALDKSISLSRGQFPDWLRIQGTRFKINSVYNSGSPYFTVASSPNDQEIIVEEVITDQVSNDARFIQYMASLEIPKEFRACRDNVIILSILERVAGNSHISSQYILDKRPAMANNFVISGCSAYKDSSLAALEIGITPGEFCVEGDKEFLEDEVDWKVTVTDNSLNYIYLTSSGDLQVSLNEPMSFHVMLAEARAIGGSIDLRDVRQFRPVGGGADGQDNGEVLTGFNTVSHNFVAGENISAFDVVFIDSDSKVRKSSTSDKNKLPVRGIATQATAANQENTFVTFGIVSNKAWSSWLIPGEDVFADASSGKLVHSDGIALLSSGQYVQRVGIALSTKEIFFAPELSYIKKDNSAETPLLTLRPTGEIEVMGPEDRLSPDRLNFLASVAQTPNTTSFNIYPGRYFVEGNIAKAFSGQVVAMGTTGTTYKTTAISAGYYNKAFFTLDREGLVRMYEGIPSSTIPVDDPITPDSEMPLSVITFKDDGSAGAGTILAINSLDITDKRPWLNLGSTEDTAFQAIYRGTNKVLVIRGEAWISKKYITLLSNQEITVPTVDGSYYFYLNLTPFGNVEPNLTHIANSSHFVASTNLPTQVHRRDYILLAKYDVASGEIVRNTFKTFKSKFWDFQDIPFYGEQIWETTSIVPAGTSFFTNAGDTSEHLAAAYQFTDHDFLKVMINGDEFFEEKDFVKAGLDNVVVADRNGVKFLFDMPVGAEIRIRKI